MIALATSAIASGSSRGRPAKTRPRASAITSTTAASSHSIARVSELVEIGDDHGLAGDQIAPAVFESPLRHPHRAADQRDRTCALGFAQPGPRRTETSEEFGLGKR